MSKERKFHEFIEQQNREEKDAVWAKLQQKEAEREQEKPAHALPKVRSFFGRKWAPIVVSSLTAVVIGVFATWGFLSLNDEKNGILDRNHWGNFALLHAAYPSAPRKR